MPLLQSERRARTTRFAMQWGLQNPRIVKPVDGGLNITFKAPGDLEVAQGCIDAVQAAKVESEKRGGMSKIFTSKPKASKYKPREITAALQSVIQTAGSPGVVEILLELLLQHGGDVNVTRKSTTKWKRLAKVDQEDTRTGLLATATKVGNINTIRLLLLKTQADDISINEALGIALYANPISRDLDIIELLLAYGADASLHFELFASAVRNSDHDLVGLLLTAPKSVSISTMTDALYTAVEIGALDMAYILAQTGADGDADSGKALRRAISTTRHELVTIMTLCHQPPSQLSLDEAVPFIFLNTTTSNKQNKELLEALLVGGATGARAASVLLELVKQCTARNVAAEAGSDPLFDMINHLLRANTSLEFENAAALRNVVSSSRVDLIDMFISLERFDDRLASIAFSSIDLNASPGVRVAIASKLLAKGASGTPLHEALIYAVKTDHTEAINLLLAGNGLSKASVDYHDAAAIKNAISREKTEIVKLLLERGSPQASSASSAFPNIWLCSKEGRLALAQALLSHGAAGVNVDTGLLLALEDRGPIRDHRLIKLLVKRPTDLGFENGKALELAVASRDMTALEILLAEKPPSQYLTAAFAAAMTLRPVEYRFTACDMLLKAGATGTGVNEALTIAVSEESSNTSFLKILIPNTNINHNGGHALSEAIKRSRTKHVSLLLEQHARLNAASFTNAFNASLTLSEPAEELKYCRMILEASPPEMSTSVVLLKIVRAGNEDLCTLFLQHKADLNFDGGICLVSAVHAQDVKILTLLVESTNPKPSKQSLEAAFNAACGITDKTCRLEIVQILLDAGVNGEPLHSALPTQAKGGDTNIALCSMLLKYGASIDAQNGAPLVVATKLRATVLLQTMLQGRKASYNSLSRAFKSAEKDRIDLVKIFLDAGLTGDPIDSALAEQAKRGSNSLSVCGLLLAHGASADAYNGEALMTAAKLAALPLLQAMIQRNVSNVSLTRAFESADRQNLDLVKIFLDAGLKGEPLHTALVEQSKRGNEAVAVCTLLLAYGASADEYNGEALTIAAKLESLPLLRAMLKGKMMSKATLNRAFMSASHDNLELVTILLDAGTTGEPLNIALVEQSKRGDEAIAVCKLLLARGASVDANQGKALNNAAKLDAHHLLKVLLRQRPVSDTSLARAFEFADRDNSVVVKIFLDAGLKGDSLHSTLVEQSRRGNDSLAVCTLLITHGASLNSNNGEALANAARLRAVPLLRMMLQGEGILNTSLTVAFNAADLKQYEVVELFLTAGLQGEPLHAALVMQAQRGVQGLAICDLLLKHGANINEYEGESLNEAVASGTVELVHAMLLGQKATSKTLFRAFESAVQLNDELRLVMIHLLVDAGLQAGPKIDAGLLELVKSGSKDTESMRELLNLGASVHHDNHGALDAAAQLCNHEVLLLLLEYLIDESAPSLMFKDRLQESWNTLTKEVVDTLEILLAHGAHGEYVQKALVLAISESDSNPLARDFAGILLNHDVDVNYEQGRPLQIAAEIAAIEFLSVMITKGATPESLLMAFPHIFKVQPRPSEATMLSLIKLFREHAGEKLSSFVHPTIPDPPVFMGVYNYPQCSRVLEALLDAGFSVDPKMAHRLPNLGNVMITPLYWALLDHEKVVTEPVVYMLLKRGASVEGHPTPLLHLAIARGYSSVVQLLIEAGADVDCANTGNETPLLLAYQSGDLSTIKALLNAECEPDDGTLHDAARRLDIKVIELLLEHDHDPNRPSPEHEGRTALAELVYNAPIFAKRTSDKNLERDAKKAIKLMAKEGARTNIQTRTADDTEKSLLLLAIDSPNPLVMTKALLDADQWKFVNEDFNLYNDGEYTYSPITYVEKGAWAGDPAQATSVLNLLKTFQVKRRFWKNQGEQPSDMVDAPPEITAAENARKAALAEALRKEAESRALLAKIEADKRAKIAEIEAETHAEYTRRAKRAELERALAQEDHEAELAAQARTRELELKYQENLLELEQKRRQVATDEQLRKQQGLSDIQMRLEQQSNEQALRVLEEKRRGMQEKARAGYMVMDVYQGMQRSGLGLAAGGGGGGYGGGSSRAQLGAPPVRRAIQHGHVSDSDDDY